MYSLRSGFNWIINNYFTFFLRHRCFSNYANLCTLPLSHIFFRA